ncbi:unknown [Prevotella sp. CAG:604]|nr:unknown [Prevotella sp. CAG:604]
MQVITQHPYCMSCYVNTVSQRVLLIKFKVRITFFLILIKFKVVNYIFYSFYQNNAIGFNCLRSRFHCSTK